MCGTQHIEGGGPIPELRTLIKEIWCISVELDVTLTPHWLKRSEWGMTVADKLSKTDTKWVLKQTFRSSLEQKLGLEVNFPDVANAKSALLYALATGWKGAMILPIWPGQPWWQTVVDNTTLHMISDIREAITPNNAGMPRWEFTVAVF